MEQQEQQTLLETNYHHKLFSFSKEELVKFIDLQQEVISKYEKENEKLRSVNNEFQQKYFLIDEQYIVLKNKFFGRSSEKEPVKKNNERPPKKNKKKIQLPSLRYPNAPLIERDIEFRELPECSVCGEKMRDSGMTEDSEYLTVIPAQFMVIRQKRHKYSCGHCHGDLKTAPAEPRIKAGSAFSDSMILDVALSKYCDLVPIERYSAIAGREGLKDLPPQSLIELTHYLADFTFGAYEKIREEILAAPILHADETPHKMLEGDKKKNWFLWGFSTNYSSYYEARNTRSGDVASELLQLSKCEYLMSDVFSGYKKSVTKINEVRTKNKAPLIQSIYCNAHSRRKFKEAHDNFLDEAQYFIDRYRFIYHLESEARGTPPDKILENRFKMKHYFEEMQIRAIENIARYSKKSSIAKAMSYFLSNYKELTLFLNNAFLPIDNNHQERLLRSPVIGRKTWYGTHSKRGAKTAIILFSLIESCKINNVNPRDYFKKLVEDLHHGKKPYTPKNFKDLSNLS